MKSILGLILIGVIITFVFLGCNKLTEGYVKGYEDSPLLPATAPATKIFAGAQAAFIEFYEGTPSKLAAIWAQQATGADRQYMAFDIYNMTANDFSNDWFLAYTRVLTNLKIAQQKAQEEGLLNLYGAAKILEGIHMGMVAALWGDVPYSEAAQPERTLTPKYDNQIEVYRAAIAAIDEGIQVLTQNTAALPQDLFSTGGSTAKWIKAGYSAKARYLMHLARRDNYPTAVLDQVISAALNGIIATTRTGTPPAAGYGTDDLVFTHGTTYQGNMNLWHSFIVQDRSGYLRALKCYAVRMLGARGTAESGRFNYYFTADSNDLRTTGTAAYAANAYFPVIRASETLLLLAEAYARKGDLANAVTYLNRANTYTNTIFGTTLRTNYTTTDFPTQADLLQAIFNEMYLALMHQVEVFNFLRRIDYQIQYRDGAGNIVRLTPKRGTVFPQRFFYPQSEVSTNPNIPWIQAADDLFAKTRVNGGTR